MTTINILKTNNQVSEIIIEGHSGYGTKGNDIVCSSISSAFYLLVFILDELKVDYFMKDDEEAVAKLVIKEFNSIIRNVLDGSINYYTELEKQYSEHLKVKIGD